MRIQKSDLSREAGRGKNLMSGKGTMSGKAGSLMSECSAARLLMSVGILVDCGIQPLSVAIRIAAESTIAGTRQTEIFVGIVRPFPQNQVLAH